MRSWLFLALGVYIRMHASICRFTRRLFRFLYDASTFNARAWLWRQGYGKEDNDAAFGINPYHRLDI
jgi:hypothetical protein